MRLDEFNEGEPNMNSQKILGAALLATAAFTALAQERLEGKVTGTRVTLCQFKPGGCEGTLTLERASGGKNEEITVKVPLGTMITKGKEVVYLPVLRGKSVAVTYVMEKGERTARAIEVTSP
jgi:hypothetical protein